MHCNAGHDGGCGSAGSCSRPAWFDAFAARRDGHADVAKVVQEYKAGKVEFRNDSGGNVHAVVGKLSFERDKLQENIQSFIDHINSLKPAAVKGVYVRGVSISATMSPGIAVAA